MYRLTGLLNRATFKHYLDPVMQPIDVGDLQLDDQHDASETTLFHAIREKDCQDL